MSWSPRTELEQAAFDAGVACHLEGPDDENCSHAHFTAPELIAAWMRGKATAEHREADTARELAAGGDW